MLEAFKQVHRWVGIATRLVFALWFASGLVMAYVPFPTYGETERLEHLPSIDWSEVKVTPEQVMQAENLTRFPARPAAGDDVGAACLPDQRRASAHRSLGRGRDADRDPRRPRRRRCGQGHGPVEPAGAPGHGRRRPVDGGRKPQHRAAAAQDRAERPRGQRGPMSPRARARW